MCQHTNLAANAYTLYKMIINRYIEGDGTGALWLDVLGWLIGAFSKLPFLQFFVFFAWERSFLSFSSSPLPGCRTATKPHKHGAAAKG
jgi:hypothetical protein